MCACVALQGCSVEEAFDLELEMRALNGVKDPPMRGGVVGSANRGGHVGSHWRLLNLTTRLGVSSLSAAELKGWVTGLRDDEAFGRHMSAQRCADEVDANFAKCKAAMLCAMQELEDERYVECSRKVVASAVPPTWWVEGVKQSVV